MNKKQQRLAAIQRQQELVNAARSANRSLNDAEQKEFDDLTAKIQKLDREIEEESRQQPAAQNAQADTAAADTRAATEAERSRISEIMTLCRDFDIDAQRYIDNGSTVEQVRAAILNNLRSQNAPIPANSVSTEARGEDEFRRDMAEAITIRAGVTDGANASREVRRMAGMSLRDIAIECLVREGRSDREARRMSGSELYDEMSRQFYNPTAAFPAILDSSIKKSIVDLYNAVPTTFQLFTTKGTLKDFKETPDHEYVIGGAGEFVRVPEGGELKHDTPSTEQLPKRKLDTYGRQFSMTRQAFINDDIGFVTEIPGLYATAAKKTIDKQVYKLLFDNSTIFDGTALFHNDHKNLIGSGSKPTQAAIQAMILKMQMQTDQFGEAIYVTPRYIIVPIGYGFDLDVILHSAAVPGSPNNDINPLKNRALEVIETPVLNALAGANAVPWFMSADKASTRGIQVDYLNGQETPTVRRWEKPGQLGFIWDMYLDWGISVRDFRGLVKNPGAVLS